MSSTTTQTRTVDSLKWECSQEEGLWFCGEFRIGRSDRRGRRSQWELFHNNECVMIGKTCHEMMQCAARRVL